MAGLLLIRGVLTLRVATLITKLANATATNMKIILISLLACTFSLGAAAKGGSHGGSGHSSHGSNSSYGSGHVNLSNHTIRGHTTKDGTYVAPSHATNPNSTKSDNYTTKGNVNPYTGAPGTRNSTDYPQVPCCGPAALNHISVA